MHPPIPQMMIVAVHVDVLAVSRLLVSVPAASTMSMDVVVPHTLVVPTTTRHPLTTAHAPHTVIPVTPVVVEATKLPLPDMITPALALLPGDETKSNVDESRCMDIELYS